MVWCKHYLEESCYPLQSNILGRKKLNVVLNVFDVIYVLSFSLPEDQYFYFLCVVYYYVALLLNEFFFRYILCPAMYRKLSKGGSQNNNARCSTTRGKIT